MAVTGGVGLINDQWDNPIRIEGAEGSYTGSFLGGNWASYQEDEPLWLKRYWYTHNTGGDQFLTWTAPSTGTYIFTMKGTNHVNPGDTSSDPYFMLFLMGDVTQYYAGEVAEGIPASQRVTANVTPFYVDVLAGVHVVEGREYLICLGGQAGARPDQIQDFVFSWEPWKPPNLGYSFCCVHYWTQEGPVMSAVPLEEPDETRTGHIVLWGDDDNYGYMPASDGSTMFLWRELGWSVPNRFGYAQTQSSGLSTSVNGQWTQPQPSTVMSKSDLLPEIQMPAWFGWNTSRQLLWMYDWSVDYSWNPATHSSDIDPLPTSWTASNFWPPIKVDGTRATDLPDQYDLYAPVFVQFDRHGALAGAWDLRDLWQASTANSGGYRMERAPANWVAADADDEHWWFATQTYNGNGFDNGDFVKVRMVPNEPATIVKRVPYLRGALNFNMGCFQVSSDGQRIVIMGRPSSSYSQYYGGIYVQVISTDDGHELEYFRFVPFPVVAESTDYPFFSYETFLLDPRDNNYFFAMNNHINGWNDGPNIPGYGETFWNFVFRVPLHATDEERTKAMRTPWAQWTQPTDWAETPYYFFANIETPNLNGGLNEDRARFS